MKNPTNHIGLEGRYKLVLTKPNGESRVVAEFPNLITNLGLERIATGSWGTQAMVGSGATAPSVLDTQLANQIGGSASLQGVGSAPSSVAPYPFLYGLVYRFNPGVGTGNIAEVGLGWADTNGLFSRALVLDGDGNPTTITKLADEVLDVYYQLVIYPPGDVTGTINLGGVDYAYLVRPQNVTNGNWIQGAQSGSFSSFGFAFPSNSMAVYGGAAGTVGDPSGTPINTAGLQGFTPVNNAYVPNSKTLTFTLNLGLNDADYGGGISVIGFAFYTIGQFQMAFTPPIPKDGSKVLTMTFAFTWGRHTG